MALQAGLSASGFLLIAVGAFMVLVPKRVDLVLRWATAAAGRLRGRFLRLVGRPQARIVGAGAGTMAVVGASAAGIVSIAEDAPLEQQLAFLRTQAIRVQKRLSKLEDEVREHPARWKRELDDLRADLRAWVGAELDRSQDAYLRLRISGTLVALAGNGLLAF